MTGTNLCGYSHKTDRPIMPAKCARRQGYAWGIAHAAAG